MAKPLVLPRPDEELALAVRLLGHDSALDLQILDALVGRPQRYSELQELLAGRNDTVLNRAIARLRSETLIQQHLDLAARQRQYQLTSLGKLVLYRLQQMRPHHDSIAAYERGQAAQSA